MNRLRHLTSKVLSWLPRNDHQQHRGLDLGLLRISPVDSGHSLKESSIALGRHTVVRKLSQDSRYADRINPVLFEQFCRYLDAAIADRHNSFVRQLQTLYARINPDVDALAVGAADGATWGPMTRRQLLDEEFWFMQRLSRLLQLANFTEMTRDELTTWLGGQGRYNTVEVFMEPSSYDLLKVWLLGRESPVSSKRSVLHAMLAKYAPLAMSSLRPAAEGSTGDTDSPFTQGDRYRRVAVAVREKRSTKIELKLFRQLSQGELIQLLPRVEMRQAPFDSGVLLCTGALCVVGVGTHLLLPAVTLGSGWLLATSHQLANSLALLSAAVGLFNWHVIQQKRGSYWKWRSQLNYRSIVANNKGVINLVGDRAQDEIFKEALLAYVTILCGGDDDIGKSQRQLEEQVKTWVSANDSPEFQEYSCNLEINLTEALSLLRQLNIVHLDPPSGLFTAKSMEMATAMLGAEFTANNLSFELDGSIIMPMDSSYRPVTEPATDQKVVTKMGN